MPKKQTPLKGLGARYGIKPRKQYSQIHRILKSKRKCPDCAASLTRDAVGIWSCKKCSFKVAGTAYDIKL
jgi:large subunit ribosomal protein L37Ae